MRTLAGPVMALLVLAEASAARADAPKDACFDAYENAQRLRKEGRLRAAQSELAKCAVASCPGFVTKDCTQWSLEVETNTPSVIFVARDPAGRDLANVRVVVDGVEAAKVLDGRPVPLDPGAHKLRYEWDGKTVETSVVLAEREKARRAEATFTAPVASPAPPTRADGEPSHTTTIPVASLVLGGIAVVGGASFVVFGLLGKAKEACAPNCTQAEVSTLRRDYLIADFSLIGALVAAGVGVTLWALEPAAPRKASVVVLPSVGGLSLGARAAF